MSDPVDIPESGGEPHGDPDAITEQHITQEIEVPPCEFEAMEQLNVDVFGDEDPQEATMILVTALMEVLLESGVIPAKAIEKKYTQLVCEFDQEAAANRDQWTSTVREQCPTICRKMDEIFGEGNWGPNDVRTE